MEWASLQRAARGEVPAAAQPLLRAGAFFAGALLVALLIVLRGADLLACAFLAGAFLAVAFFAAGRLRAGPTDAVARRAGGASSSGSFCFTLKKSAHGSAPSNSSRRARLSSV